MDILSLQSQEKVSVMEYVVWWADYELDEQSDCDCEYWWNCNHESLPSNKIDDRTIRTKIFPTKEEAIKFARDMLEHRGDDKWLAYIEVKKCHITVVEKIK